MRFLPRDGRQQPPVYLPGIFFKHWLQVRENAFHGAQEGAGINVIKIVAVAEVFLLQPREGAVFINIIEEIEHCRRQGIIFAFFAKPGDRLLVADIEGDGQLRVNALEQADGDRIRHGIVELAIDDRLH